MHVNSASSGIHGGYHASDLVDLGGGSGIVLDTRIQELWVTLLISHLNEEEEVTF